MTSLQGRRRILPTGQDNGHSPSLVRGVWAVHLVRKRGKLVRWESDGGWTAPTAPQTPPPGTSLQGTRNGVCGAKGLEGSATLHAVAALRSDEGILHHAVQDLDAEGLNVEKPADMPKGHGDEQANANNDEAPERTRVMNGRVAHFGHDLRLEVQQRELGALFRGARVSCRAQGAGASRPRGPAHMKLRSLQARRVGDGNTPLRRLVARRRRVLALGRGHDAPRPVQR